MKDLPPDVFIHVGLPKTGSSFLQIKIFPYMTNCLVYGMYNTRLHLDTYLPSNKKIIISNEQYSGKINNTFKCADRYEIAMRLKALFWDAKIIIVLRNKKIWIQSLYKEYLTSSFGVLDFDDWYKTVFDQTALDFDFYIDFLSDLFEDVLVLQFEDLIKDPMTFIDKLSGYIGSKLTTKDFSRVNIAADLKTLARRKKFNRFFRSHYSKHKGIFPEWFNPIHILHKYEKSRRRI